MKKLQLMEWAKDLSFKDLSGMRGKFTIDLQRNEAYGLDTKEIEVMLEILNNEFVARAKKGRN